MQPQSTESQRFSRPGTAKMGLLVTGVILAALILPSCAAAITHPSLLFESIDETPGYQHRTVQPWIGWENSIRASATGALSRDFSDPAWTSYNRLVYRSAYARDLGLMYQITKDSQYAAQARDALENIGVSSDATTADRALSLEGYAIAYDCIQPTLDAATDARLRDKLALYTDRVFRDLNVDGTRRDYVSFADYHGQAYPNVAIAGMALADYTNPNGLALIGTPTEWQKCGTDYLFEDDLLHSYHRSLLSFGFDEASGKHQTGSYKAYVLEEFIAWFQVYSHVKGHSIFLDYPTAKLAFTSEIWESLPNGYHNNYCTSGNIRWTYIKSIVNLLPDAEKGAALWQTEAAAATNLPYSSTESTTPPYIFYLTCEDTSGITRAPPSGYTSVLNQDAIYQVFRSDWTKDATWLSLVTFNAITRSNRDSAHHDQLAFEYYSHGDLLLADAGEDKYVLDMYYGPYEIYHNTVAVEDPQTPFAEEPWSGSAARGFFKGNANAIYTPVSVDVTETGWMEALSGSTTATKVIGANWGVPQDLSSPINYERTVLFPEQDYFAVIDRLEGSESWIYRSMFRPTSLSITPTTDINGDHVFTEAETGHVNGVLTVGDKTVGWTGLTYKDETSTGIVTGDVRWTTTNPYGQAVELQLFTAPAAEVLVTKHVGRIAGYAYRSEVFLPVLSFRSPEADDLYRVTVLLPRYTSEAGQQARELAVTGTGTGTAVAVTGPDYEDAIYSGSGTSAFGGYATDAETAFIRTDADGAAVTLLAGTVLSRADAPWIQLPAGTQAFSMQQQNGGVTCTITGSGSGSGDIVIADTGTVTSVIRDGAPYGDWVQDGSGIVITTTLSDHTFTITSSAAPNTAPVLSWTGEAEYTADGLNPESGTTETGFLFRIAYRDADGDEPLAGYPKLHILNNGTEIADSPYALTKVAGTPAAGAVYAATVTLEAGTGYSYYFGTWDARGAVAAATSELQAPVVTEAPLPPEEWLKGDLNDNGEIDIGDASKIVYMNADSIPDDIRGDFNGNGVIDENDASRLAEYYLGLIIEL